MCYGLWLNHKGRVLADSFALVVGSAEVWLVSYFSASADIRGWLDGHVVADDVIVEDHTAAWRGLALAGTAAPAWLRQAAGVVPPPQGQFVRAGNGFVFRGRRSSGESWEWLAPAVSPPPKCAVLPEISPTTMELMRLADNLPAVPADIGRSDLPHEAGLDVTAVSYTKGCYVGQEVMARLRTGKIRRRLVRVSGPDLSPGPLAPLLQKDKKVGELRSAAADGRGGFLGLAMLTLLGLDPDAPLALAPGTPAAIRPLDHLVKTSP